MVSRFQTLFRSFLQSVFARIGYSHPLIFQLWSHIVGESNFRKKYSISMLPLGRRSRSRSSSDGGSSGKSKSGSVSSSGKGRLSFKASFRRFFRIGKSPRSEAGESASASATPNSLPTSARGHVHEGGHGMEKSLRFRKSTTEPVAGAGTSSRDRHYKTHSTASSQTTRSVGSSSIYSKVSGGGSIVFSSDALGGKFTSESTDGEREIFSLSVDSLVSGKSLLNSPTSHRAEQAPSRLSSKAARNVATPPAAPSLTSVAQSPSAPSPTAGRMTLYGAYSAPRADAFQAFQENQPEGNGGHNLAHTLSISVPTTPVQDSADALRRQASAPHGSAPSRGPKALTRAVSENVKGLSTGKGIAQVSHRPANKVHQDIEKSMSILMRLRAHANRGMEGGAEISASEVSTLLKTVSASLIHNEAYHVRDLMIKRGASRKGKHKTLTRGIEAYFFHELNLHRSLSSNSMSAASSDGSTRPASSASIASMNSSGSAKPPALNPVLEGKNVTDSNVDASASNTSVPKSVSIGQQARKLFPSPSEPTLLSSRRRDVSGKRRASNKSIISSKSSSSKRASEGYGDVVAYDGSLRMLLPSGPSQDSIPGNERARTLSFTVPNARDAPPITTFSIRCLQRIQTQGSFCREYTNGILTCFLLLKSSPQTQ